MMMKNYNIDTPIEFLLQSLNLTSLSNLTKNSLTFLSENWCFLVTLHAQKSPFL